MHPLVRLRPAVGGGWWQPALFGNAPASSRASAGRAVKSTDSSRGIQTVGKRALRGWKVGRQDEGRRDAEPGQQLSQAQQKTGPRAGRIVMGMHVVYRKLRMQVCRRKHLPR